MCGIGGAHSLRGELPPRVLEAVSRLPGALSHRGPDAAGTWLSPDRATALAATRLAIRDLSPVADQPFTSGRGATVYNGELYDWEDTLADRGPRLSTGDTEIIHQITCTDPLGLARVSGMYAVATWQAASGSLVLGRDPAGEKQVYLVRGDGWVAFASELRALLTVGLLEPEIDREAVAALLRLGHVPEPLSIFAGAEPLGAGTILEIRPDGSELRHFCRAETPSDSGAGNANGLCEPVRVRRTVVEAVRLASVADVPTGIFLSGGVDSSVIAAAAAAAERPLTALTLAPSDGGADESGAASATARHLGLDHRIVRVSPDDARERLPDFFRAMDQPTVDGFNSYLISGAARSSDLKVALSGVGGDELFRGYGTFATMALARGLLRLPAGRMTLSRLAARLPRRERSADLGWAKRDFHAYVAIRGVLSQERTERLIGGGTDWDALWERVEPPTGGLRGDGQTSRLEAQGYMRNQLLRDLDVFAMACSLEVRAPMLLPSVMTLAAAMPNQRQLRGKRVLKDAFRDDLPAGMLDRPKRGFELPWDRWLRTSLRSETLDLLHSRNGKAAALIDTGEALRLHGDFEAGRLPWSRLWAVVVLLRWLPQATSAS